MTVCVAIHGTSRVTRADERGVREVASAPGLGESDADEEAVGGANPALAVAG